MYYKFLLSVERSLIIFFLNIFRMELDQILFILMTVSCTSSMRNTEYHFEEPLRFYENIVEGNLKSRWVPTIEYDSIIRVDRTLLTLATFFFGKWFMTSKIFQLEKFQCR